jgi:hypothetical protein
MALNAQNITLVLITFYLEELMLLRASLANIQDLIKLS